MRSRPHSFSANSDRLIGFDVVIFYLGSNKNLENVRKEKEQKEENGILFCFDFQVEYTAEDSSKLGHQNFENNEHIHKNVMKHQYFSTPLDRDRQSYKNKMCTPTF